MRLFVTVGNVLQPFERLAALVDDALSAGAFDATGVFQCGPCTRGIRGLESRVRLSQQEFEAEMEKADAVICHGGVGTLFLALKHRHKPIVVPRRASLGEHVNDHQHEIVEAMVRANKVVPVETAAAMEAALRTALQEKPSLRPDPGAAATINDATRVIGEAFHSTSGAPSRVRRRLVSAIALFSPTLGALRSK